MEVLTTKKSRRTRGTVRAVALATLLAAAIGAPLAASSLDGAGRLVILPYAVNSKERRIDGLPDQSQQPEDPDRRDVRGRRRNAVRRLGGRTDDLRVGAGPTRREPRDQPLEAVPEAPGAGPRELRLSPVSRHGRLRQRSLLRQQRRRHEERRPVPGRGSADRRARPGSQRGASSVDAACHRPRGRGHAPARRSPRRRTAIWGRWARRRT